MAIRKQIYSPDSCGCVVEEQYDDTLSSDVDPVLAQFLVKCAAHQKVTDNVKAFTTMLKENKQKNALLKHLMDANVLPMSMIDTVEHLDTLSNTKTTTRVLGRNVIYNYYHKDENGNPENRTLVFSLQGLDKNGNVITFSNAEKASINNVLHAKLGAKFQYVDILHEDLDPDYKHALHIRNTKDYKKATAKFREPTDEEKSQTNFKDKVRKFIENF